MIEIKNGRIVTPDEIIEGRSLLIEDGVIQDICVFTGKADRTIDAHGRYILPGFIDVHSDKVEKFISPRPTAVFDYELALKECEKELLQLGITTIYHSFSLYETKAFGPCTMRNKESVARMAALLADIHNRNHLIHHRCHLRIEIDYLEAYDIAKSMMEQGLVHEISFMDHTPGQGQYRDLAIYEKSIDTSEATFEEILEEQRTKKTLSLAQLRELAGIAHAKGITVASHDDDTVEKLELNEKIGVDISEFPITIAVAKEASKRGYYTVVGAPNILLGGSHSGNMSAAEAINEGCGDILCSDYYPQAILHSIFTMHTKYGQPLPEMVKKATLNPAKAMKIDKEYGSIEIGKKADLSIVDILDGYPVITHVLVDGRPTSRVEYRR
ncbi:MAG: alpha-D-ribose 1-methylphosphonate 5-triphosphate diphosphatase [Ruminococcus sp.]|nr:alpha-D-ribose 1-methylphosphonate 5-triphosphate diphosphatase [Ruminococcus sp.]